MCWKIEKKKCIYSRDMASAQVNYELLKKEIEFSKDLIPGMC